MYSGSAYDPVYQDNGSSFTAGSQWWDKSSPPNRNADDAGDHKFPVAYVYGGDPIVVSVVVKVRQGVTLPNTNYKIKGEGLGNNFAIPWTTATPGQVSTDEIGIQATASTNNLPSQIKAHLPFKIKWSFSCDGGTTPEEAGISDNPLYVHRGPVTTVNDRYTMVHLSCDGADGLGDNDDDQIVADIWDQFAGRKVVRVSDKAKMGYYFNWNTPHATANGLLANADGHCDAWADLFHTCLVYQNITDADVVIHPPGDGTSTGILVDAWSFPAGNQGGAYPNGAAFNAPSPVQLNGVWQYNWRYNEILDLSGVSGQNTPNPLSAFNHHTVVERADIIYDPSYGTIYQPQGNTTALELFENTAIDGYNKIGLVTFVENGNPVTVTGWLVKTNPAGNQLQ